MKYQNNLQIKINHARQSGAAVLISMVVLASVAAFYLLGQFGAVSQKQARQDNRIESMAKAKNSLIAYAVNYIDTHDGEFGFLPCPDTDEGGLNPKEGNQDIGCGNANENSMGRFPFRSVHVAPQKDEANECLWYVVSGYYKNQPQTEMLNEDTNGMLDVFSVSGTRIYGDNPEDRVVALIISPGTPLNQNRIGGIVNTEQCGGSYIASNYLEGDGVRDNSTLDGNDDVLDQFIKAGTNSNEAATPFNDLIITITRDEIWNAVQRRHDYDSKLETLTREITDCIISYGEAGTAQNLPWPSDLLLDGNMYREDASYNDIDFNNAATASYFGRLARTVSFSEQELFDRNGNGNNGNGNNGNGNNGNGNNGNGNNGNAATPCEDDCQTTYDDEVAAADQAYDDSRIQVFIQFDICRFQGGGASACAAVRKQAIADADAIRDARIDAAQTVLDQCIATCTNTPGNGSSPKGYEDLFSTACMSDESLALWPHWKDHFFYAVSKDYAPDSGSVACAANCVTTTGGGATKFAGIVLFSRERLSGITRNDPIFGDVDSKGIITNYLEGDNQTSYPDLNGNNNFDASMVGGNDYLYCISEGNPLTAAACP